jgi:hypothetical protein
VLRLNDDPSMQAALDKFLQDAPDPNCTAVRSFSLFSYLRRYYRLNRWFPLTAGLRRSI